MHLRALDWMRYSWHYCPFHGSMMKLISQREILLKLLYKNGTQLFRAKSDHIAREFDPVSAPNPMQARCPLPFP